MRGIGDGLTKPLAGYDKEDMRKARHTGPVALGKPWLFVLLACWLGFGNAVVAVPESKQCPTAKVQQIRVAIESDCGHTVGYEFRAPQPGEEAFVECHCAEKHTQSDRTFVSSAAIFSEGFSLEIPVLALIHAEPTWQESRFPSLVRPPLSPPPLSV